MCLLLHGQAGRWPVSSLEVEVSIVVAMDMEVDSVDTHIEAARDPVRAGYPLDITGSTLGPAWQSEPLELIASVR